MNSSKNFRKNLKLNLLISPEDSSKKSDNNGKKMEKKMDCLQKIRNILHGDVDIKLLFLFMTLGALRREPCTIVITGQSLMRRRNLVRSVLHLYPEVYVYINSETGNTSKKTLMHRNWKLEKILFLTNFDNNRRLIRKFVNDEWIFSEILKDFENYSVQEITIPKMTVISTTTKLDEEICENSFVVRLGYAIRESQARSEYNADLSSKLYKKIFNETKNNILLTEIKEFLLNLDKSLRVEIPFVSIVKKYFRYGLPKSELYHHYFLELIKNIAFFNQNSRDRYQIKGEDITVLLANFEDYELALNLGCDIFTIEQQNFKRKYSEFYKFILKWVEENCRDLDDFSAYSFTRSKLISDFRDEEIRIHGVTRTYRTYENYIDYLVRSGHLELRGRRGSENLYRIKDAPSLKTVDLFNERMEVLSCIDERIFDLLDNPNVKFIAINE